MMKRLFVGALVALALVVSVVPADAYEYCPWWMECLGWC